MLEFGSPWEPCPLSEQGQQVEIEYRRPSIDRFRIQIDEEKANLYRSGHSPEMEIPVRKARLSKVRLNWTKKLFEEVRLS